MFLNNLDVILVDCCSYDVEFKQEAFYTGGQVCVTNDGTHLMTTCRDSVKVLDLSTGLVVNTIKEVSHKDRSHAQFISGQ